MPNSRSIIQQGVSLGLWLHIRPLVKGRLYALAGRKSDKKKKDEANDSSVQTWVEILASGKTQGDMAGWVDSAEASPKETLDVLSMRHTLVGHYVGERVGTETLGIWYCSIPMPQAIAKHQDPAGVL